ncbi:hypothetical protein ABIF65_005997 [Bradyrhizobium japonicum]|uniref:Uncharacterized protein n=1 Tax=Bradyrhizobium barranii subsp. barranii TaxID=2823807 RepID=A0A939MIU3_9BRAD|nr:MULTISPECIES: hypothetical protein [Bradyrhizobium]MBR1002722.1 hypothetical protein [Bradyrhizobium liaoningense]MBR1025595.1 hypothetical protein [Bradyrhizobium liaoningense]MBR1068322.1 hypothetical protein [Bradyrhizobium liaoningense]MCP1744335.1 hypothetical protein [Bradyrhizobium japonicum]MCP1782614.1 hypothetical protein [Bradyrhizobium japonicum]
MRKVAADIIEALRSQPMALAVVVINLLFLTGFAFMLREIVQAVARKDALLAEIASHCMR